MSGEESVARSLGQMTDLLRNMSHDVDGLERRLVSVEGRCRTVETRSGDVSKLESKVAALENAFEYKTGTKASGDSEVSVAKFGVLNSHVRDMEKQMTDVKTTLDSVHKQVRQHTELYSKLTQGQEATREEHAEYLMDTRGRLDTHEQAHLQVSQLLEKTSKTLSEKLKKLQIEQERLAQQLASVRPMLDAHVDIAKRVIHRGFGSESRRLDAEFNKIYKRIQEESLQTQEYIEQQCSQNLDRSIQSAEMEVPSSLQRWASEIIKVLKAWVLHCTTRDVISDPRVAQHTLDGLDHSVASLGTKLALHDDQRERRPVTAWSQGSRSAVGLERTPERSLVNKPPRHPSLSDLNNLTWER